MADWAGNEAIQKASQYEHARARMQEQDKMNMQDTYSRRSEQISDSVPRKGLIHPSFPPMGTEQPAHMGSQSTPPTKED